jgi:predicted Fe-Mo cluster-binding NifX family protein
MKLAIPVWGDRVSPVLDVAQHLLVVEVEGGTETLRHTETICDATLAQRTRLLVNLGIDAVICGAISRPLEEMMFSSGIEIVPHICGRVEEVLGVYLSGGLIERRFSMPGCCNRRRRARGGQPSGFGYGGRTNRQGAMCGRNAAGKKPLR